MYLATFWNEEKTRLKLDDDDANRLLFRTFLSIVSPIMMSYCQ